MVILVFQKQETIDESIPQLSTLFRSKGVSRILDLGCGTGRHTLYFADRGFDVYGFDLSSYALRHARKMLKARKLTANLILLDMRENFPYRDESIDAVVTIRVIHHARIRVIKHILAEIKRTLRKGGYFFAQLPTRQRVRSYEKSSYKKVEAGTHVPLEGSEKGVPHHGFTEKEISELLKDFNVQEIHEQDQHFHILAKKS